MKNLVCGLEFCSGQAGYLTGTILFAVQRAPELQLLGVGIAAEMSDVL
ncbi:hypothetical protein [Pirellula sp. SH-Sr6A]|nr:hypothetical protein [Pirellula sp. SH-Sr6A]